MSRLMGGIGGRGPGEMKLEVDRRRVRDRINLLEKELKMLGKARMQRKARRVAKEIPIVSIIGYTNAGKSTLLNAMTRSDTFVEDKLFATLDTASRRLRFPVSGGSHHRYGRFHQGPAEGPDGRLQGDP
jgi:GTP-binding protein HflX